MTWYLPFDRSCTSGVGVSGPLNERTAISASVGAVRASDAEVAGT